MAVWPYPPQGVLTDVLSPDGWLVAGLSPATEVTGAVTTEQARLFRLQYVTVESADCAGMRAFYVARRGGCDPFDFLNPNDGFAYRVRFLDTMALEWFQPTWFRAGGEVVFVVTSG